MSLAEVAAAGDERVQAVFKAMVVGGRVQDPVSRPGGEEALSAFTQAGALTPPYDPETLCLLVEHSNSLRQNVDAYATNIVPVRRTAFLRRSGVGYAAVHGDERRVV